MAKLTLSEQTLSPTTPEVDSWSIYPKSDGWYVMDDQGVETKFADINDIGSIPAWSTNQQYSSGTVIYINNLLYLCLTNHFSDVFQDDLNDNYWIMLNDFSTADRVTVENDNTIENYFNTIVNKGLSTEIVVTDMGGLSINWPVSTIYDINTKTLINIESGGATLTNNVTNYLTWVSGTEYTIKTVLDGTEILISSIGCQDADIVYINTSLPKNKRNSTVASFFGKLVPLVVPEGLSIYPDPNTTNSWDVIVDSGTYIVGSTIEKNVPQIISRSTPIIRHFKTAGSWDTDTNIEIDPTKYNDGNDLVPIEAGKYYRSAFLVSETAIHWIYPEEGADYLTAINTIASIPESLQGIPRIADVIVHSISTSLPSIDTNLWVDMRQNIVLHNDKQTGSYFNERILIESYVDDDEYELARSTVSATYNAFGSMARTNPELLPDYPNGDDIYAVNTNIGTEWTLEVNVQFKDMAQTTQSVIFGTISSVRSFLLGIIPSTGTIYVGGPTLVGYSGIVNASADLLEDEFNYIKIQRDGDNYTLTVNDTIHTFSHAELGVDSYLHTIGTDTHAATVPLNGYVKDYAVKSISDSSKNESNSYSTSAIVSEGAIYYNTTTSTIREYRSSRWHPKDVVRQWYPASMYNKDVVIFNENYFYSSNVNHFSSTDFSGDIANWDLIYDLNPSLESIKVGDSTNYTEIEDDGTIVSRGDATVWDDLVGSLVARRLESTTGKLQYNYAENSIEMQSGGSITNTADRLISNLQKPHGAKVDSEMRLHIHWEQKSSNTIEFTTQYRIQQNGKNKNTTWTTITRTSTANSVFTYTSGTLNQITLLAEIDLSGAPLSSTVQLRVARTDSTAGSIEATFIDAHIEYDMNGSRQEYVK